VVEESEKKGLEINKKKSFAMIFSKSATKPTCNITVKGEPLEQMDQFTYLGSVVTTDAKSDQEIKRRIGIAKTAYKKMTRVLESKSVTTATRLRLLKCYVWSMLLYCCE